MGKIVDEDRCETVVVPGPIDTITTTTNNQEFVNSLTITSGEWLAAELVRSAKKSGDGGSEEASGI